MRSILTLQTFILLYIIHHASITEGRLRKSKGHSRRSSTDTIHSHIKRCLQLTEHQRAAHKSPKSEFKKKTKCRSSTCHTYKQSQASGLETESRQGMIILLTVLRLCGSRVALEDWRIYCTLNQTYINVQFVYECIHRSASIIQLSVFYLDARKSPSWKHACVRNTSKSVIVTELGKGKKKKKKKGLSSDMTDTVILGTGRKKGP